MPRHLLYLVLLILPTTQTFSQAFDSEGLCDKIIEIDTAEYKSNFVTSDPIKPTNRFEKAEGNLIIRTADSTYKFTDVYEHGDFVITFKAVGEDPAKNWIWVEEQDLHSVRYFLINTRTSHIDTLIGPPQLFGDKIVCLEEGYTDSPRFVEIYKIKNDRLIPFRKFRLNPCDKLCCIRTIYLKGKTVFLADNWNKKYRAWKAKVF